MNTGDMGGQVSQGEFLDLKRTLARMLAREDLAEEIAGKALGELQTLSDAHAPQGTRRALLHDIAIELALAHLREERAEPTADAARARNPTKLTPAADRLALLGKAIERLPSIISALHPRLRQVFILRHVMTLSRETIAARLHIPTAEVDRRLQRALTVCREGLSDKRD